MKLDITRIKTLQDGKVIPKIERVEDLSDQDLIIRILDWAEDKIGFDAVFVESVSQFYEKYKRITDNQRTALENIAEKFDIL